MTQADQRVALRVIAVLSFIAAIAVWFAVEWCLGWMWLHLYGTYRELVRDGVVNEQVIHDYIVARNAGDPTDPWTLLLGTKPDWLKRFMWVVSAVFVLNGALIFWLTKRQAPVRAVEQPA